MAGIQNTSTTNYKSISTPYKHYGTKELDPGHLKNARGISIEPETGRIYVIERGNSSIKVFSPDGDHEFIFHPNRSNTDLWGICVRDGWVMVSDYYGGRLFIFTLEGELISEVGKRFTHEGEMIKLNQPMGLTMDRDREIHICEYGASQLLILTHQPNHVVELEMIEKPHDVILLKDQLSTIVLTSNYIFRSAEEEVHSLVNAYCFCWFGHIDLNGNLVLADVKNCRILTLDFKSGYLELVRTISMTANGPPMGVAVDKLSRVICVTSSKMHVFV